MNVIKPRSYEDIKALSKTHKCNVPDLLVMASQNDPFYLMPAQIKQAEWFASLWEKFGLPVGVHLRRIHYKLVVQDNPVLLLDGSPYENTEKCWSYLGQASKSARCLKLVDPTDFDDKRNPDPNIVLRYFGKPETGVEFPELGDWILPNIVTGIADNLDWEIPMPIVRGYEYLPDDRPFHVELVSEKSTMDDVIVPLCKQFGVNYAPATGFQSITGIIRMIQRIANAGKPGVILYISDFDPAGAFMPQSVARQIEFWIDEYAPKSDIVLNPVVLTLDQVKGYNLPSKPIKESDKRQNNFMARYEVGGATELDALESIYPGELAAVLKKAIEPYLDREIREVMRDTGKSAEEVAQVAWNNVFKVFNERLTAIEDDAKKIVAKYEAQLEVLRDAMAKELEPVKKTLKTLRDDIQSETDDFSVDLPARPVSKMALPDDFIGLFDSRRDYMQQIKVYKESR